MHEGGQALYQGSTVPAQGALLGLTRSCLHLVICGLWGDHRRAAAPDHCAKTPTWLRVGKKDQALNLTSGKTQGTTWRGRAGKRKEQKEEGQEEMGNHLSPGKA